MVKAESLLVVALELGSIVWAVLLGFEGTMEESISIRALRVQRMVPVAALVHFNKRCSGRPRRDLNGLCIRFNLGMVRSSGLLR
jgi:hypothetical protein